MVMYDFYTFVKLKPRLQFKLNRPSRAISLSGVELGFASGAGQ